MIRLAVIGAGHRAVNLLEVLHGLEENVRIAAVADPDPDGVRARLEQRSIPRDRARFFHDSDAMLEHADQYDGVLLGTRCNLHTPIACQVARTGLPLLLEKPAAISMAQAARLAEAFRGQEARVLVSFPLRATPLFRKALGIVQRGRLGTINQIQAWNFVPYGGVYFSEWYRDFETTGGLWLQKATHDFDFISALLHQTPAQVAAMHTQRVYGGDRPESLRCSACDQTDTCPESPKNLERRGFAGGMTMEDHACAFSESIRHQDAGAALLMYPDGTHCSYTQNFVTRQAAGRRGARVTGYHATLEFDWTTSRVHVVEHHAPDTETIDVPAGAGHGGGDSALGENFLQIIRGEAPSRHPLGDGIASAAICLAARQSAVEQAFQPIEIPGRPTPATPTMPRFVENAWPSWK